MMLSSLLKVVFFFCLLGADGFPVSEDGPPQIVGSVHVQQKAHLGKPLVLHCDALTNSEDDVTLIYWLVNGSYPEDTSSFGRMEESKESTLENDEILHRSLLLRSVTSQDLESSFTCVVTNPMGTSQKHVKLSAARGGRHTRKRRKHGRFLL